MNKENRILIEQLESTRLGIDAPEDVHRLAEMLLENAKKYADSYSEVIALYYIALYYYHKGNTTACLKHATIANEISEKNQYLDYVINTNNLLGILYNMMSEQFIGLDYLLKGYYAARKLKNDDKMSRILNNIGDMFHGLGAYEEAYKYLQRAKACRERLDYYKDETYAIIVMNIIEINLMLDREEEALKYIAAIEDSLDEDNEDILRGIIVSNEILNHFNRGNQEKAKEGIEYLLQRVLNYPEFTHAFNALMRIRYVIYQLKDRTIGDEYIRVMQILTENIEDSNYNIKNQKIIIEYYEQMGDKDKWCEALEQYYRINEENILIRKKNYSRSLIAKIQLERAIHVREEILKRNQELKVLSEVDGLTGIYNRRTVEKLISDSLTSNRHNDLCAMIIIDVDHFKSVNDRYSHLIGDEVLHEMGELLKDYFSKEVIVGRIGGDEFIVYMENVGSDEKAAKQQITLLLEEFKKEVLELEVTGYHGTISVSVGVTIETHSTTSFSMLYSNADTALYKSKNCGRDCYVFFEA